MFRWASKSPLIRWKVARSAVPAQTASWPRELRLGTGGERRGLLVAHVDPVDRPGPADGVRHGVSSCRRRCRRRVGHRSRRRVCTSVRPMSLPSRDSFRCSDATHHGPNGANRRALPRRATSPKWTNTVDRPACCRGIGSSIEPTIRLRRDAPAPERLFRHTGTRRPRRGRPRIDRGLKASSWGGGTDDTPPTSYPPPARTRRSRVTRSKPLTLGGASAAASGVSEAR